MQNRVNLSWRLGACAPATLVTLWMLSAGNATAQDTYTRIESVASPNMSLHVENGPLEVSERGPGDWSADWVIEPADAPYVRIKNRWQESYLHTETRADTVEHGELVPGWLSMMWEVIGANDHYRLRNRYTGL